MIEITFIYYKKFKIDTKCHSLKCKKGKTFYICECSKSYIKNNCIKISCSFILSKFDGWGEWVKMLLFKSFVWNYIFGLKSFKLIFIIND